jgi:hypothetical protein
VRKGLTAAVVIIATAACAKQQPIQVVFWDALPPYEIYRIPTGFTLEHVSKIASNCDRNVPVKFGLNHHDAKAGYSSHVIGFPRDASPGFRMCLVEKSRVDRVHYEGEG